MNTKVGSTGIPNGHVPQKKEKQLSFENLNKRIEKFGGKINNSQFNNDVDSLIKDIENNKEYLSKSIGFDRATQFESLLVNLLTILDQNKSTETNYNKQISSIKKELQGNKTGYFAKQEERFEYFEQKENKVFRPESSGASKSSTLAQSRVSTESVTPVVHESKDSVRKPVHEIPTVQEKRTATTTATQSQGSGRTTVTRPQVRSTSAGSTQGEKPVPNAATVNRNPAAQGPSRSYGSEIKAFGKSLELHETFKDGNCGADALQKALSSVYGNEGVSVSNPSEMRRQIATQCDNVRQLLGYARSFIEALNGLGSVDITNYYKDLIKKLELCFRDFNSFKSIVELSNDSQLKDIIKVNNWNELIEKLQNYELDSLKTILQKINGLFPINFTKEDAGVFGGRGRDGVSDSNYLDAISKDGIYLDLQEMKTTLLAYGFSAIDSQSHGSYTIFRFRDDLNREIYLYLTRYNLENSSKVESYTHWQYLTPKIIVT
ncbi:MAG: hypothetical protein ACK5Z5_09605 [Neisseriaceae bacterium]